MDELIEVMYKIGFTEKNKNYNRTFFIYKHTDSFTYQIVIDIDANTIISFDRFNSSKDLADLYLPTNNLIADLKRRFPQFFRKDKIKNILKYEKR